MHTYYSVNDNFDFIKWPSGHYIWVKTASLKLWTIQCVVYKEPKQENTQWKQTLKTRSEVSKSECSKSHMDSAEGMLGLWYWVCCS